MSNEWGRYRFFLPVEDDCVITTEMPDGPWWVSGENLDGSVIIVVCYTKHRDKIPEVFIGAYDIEESGAQTGQIVFSGRFPCPIWWDEKNEMIDPRSIPSVH